jgi:hypothetical protein
MFWHIVSVSVCKRFQLKATECSKPDVNLDNTQTQARELIAGPCLGTKIRLIL